MARRAIVLSVPTINDSRRDFETLFQLWDRANSADLIVTFDFSHCRFIRPNAVAFIGGLVKVIEDRNGTARILWDSMKPNVRSNLIENGFRSTFGGQSPGPPGHSVPYRHDLVLKRDDLVDYLKSKWLGRNWVWVSDRLQDAIVGKLWEIYANAFDHGRSHVGIFSCGQHFPKRKELHLTVLDFGIGIPENVRSHLRKNDIAASQCMHWASLEGNTTKPKDMAPGGVGLALLRDFVKINDGRLEIYSHDGYLRFEKDRELFQSLQHYFKGTLVHIALKCDESLYLLASEKVEPLQF
jgi:hypothetical protein